MPNQDPADPSPRRRASQPPVLLSRAARHAAPSRRAARPGSGNGRPSRQRRAIPLVVALVTVAGCLGGALALDLGSSSRGPAEADAPERQPPDAALAAGRAPGLTTSTSRPTAPRRARSMRKPKQTTTTIKPPARSEGGDSTAAPSAGGFPGPGNTGVPAGVSLTAGGDLTVSRAGAVIDRRDLKCLTIAASNVTVRRTRIRCGGYYPVRIANGARNVVLEDVEIDGLGSHAAIAIGTDNYTLRRADVHSVGDGPRMGDNSVVEDSWIHDLAAGGGSHNDGIQSTGGSNIKILHNRIEHPNAQTSCILIGANLDHVDDVLVQGNLLNGGNYTIYAGGKDGYRADNVRILGNRFGRDAVYGTHSIQSNIVFSGNVWNDTGAPIRK
jgi:hypothetical protein